VGGMRFTPRGVYREAQGEQRPAEWYVIWLGRPHQEGSTVIGRTKRMRRHLWHRCFPESGAACREIKGHTAGIEWLLEEHKAGRLGRRALPSRP
jgi:hypothetical protein